MKDYVIFTDSGADLGPQMVKELGVDLCYLTYRFGKEVHEGRPSDNSDKDFLEFYNRLRNGEVSSTSQVNIEDHVHNFEPFLKGGRDVLYVGFSSGLSGTFNSARLAAEELNAKYPDNKVIAVDTLAASLGQGLLVWHAVQRKRDGASIEDVAAWLEENKLNMAHWFTVDDLGFLKRGGRVSSAAALFGTMLSIKPVLHVDNAGKLVAQDKIRGRKASISALADKFEKTTLDAKDQMIFISHGDCLEDAELLAEEITKRTGASHFYFDYVGPVIGSHAGPGVIALFFLAEQR